MDKNSKNLESIIEGGKINATYYGFPDECPICHKGIDVRTIKSYADGSRAQIIFQCPKNGCHAYFIGYYSQGGRGFFLDGVRPINHVERIFSEAIKEVSPNFVSIYNESNEAEESNLLQICGVGYRKALEFLVKDYVISKINEEEIKEKIKKKFLGDVIKDDIKDGRIQALARRAAWLGNDETHYIRIWEDKDLEDLKKIIDLTLHWIEMEKLSDGYLVEMPEGKK